MSHSPNIKKINAYKPDTDSSATRVGAIKPSAIIVKLSVYFESLFIKILTYFGKFLCY